MTLPKSPSLATKLPEGNSVTKTFDGFTSACNKPWSCKPCKAEATCWVMIRIEIEDMPRPFARRNWSRLSPACSIT